MRGRERERGGGGIISDERAIVGQKGKKNRGIRSTNGGFLIELYRKGATGASVVVFVTKEFPSAMIFSS